MLDIAFLYEGFCLNIRLVMLLIPLNFKSSNK